MSHVFGFAFALLVLCIFVKLVLPTVLHDLREKRQSNRDFAAQLFADHQIMKYVRENQYDNHTRLEELVTDSEILKMEYLYSK